MKNSKMNHEQRKKFVVTVISVIIIIAMLMSLIAPFLV